MSPQSDTDHPRSRSTVSPPSGSQTRQFVEELRWRVARRERAIWVLVVVVLVADFALTLYGFQIGLVESNPLAVSLLERFGTPGIFGLKVGVLGMAIGLRWMIPDEYGVIVPVALAGPWAYAVFVNVFVIARTL